MSDDRLNDLQLERYKLGELPKNQMRKLARQIRNDPRIVERLKQLEDSDQLILEEYPPRQMAPLILGSILSGERRRRRPRPVPERMAAATGTGGSCVYGPHSPCYSLSCPGIDCPDS